MHLPAATDGVWWAQYAGADQGVVSGTAEGTVVVAVAVAVAVAIVGVVQEMPAAVE